MAPRVGTLAARQATCRRAREIAALLAGARRMASYSMRVACCVAPGGLREVGGR